MHRILMSAVLLLAFSPAPSAEEASPAPLRLRVSPSGIDHAASESLVRQERLMRRMQQSDFLFRSICVRCGGRSDFPYVTAPFEPEAALRRGAGASAADR
jgi:hypothetical protein